MMWTVLAVGRTILCVVFASGAVFARSMPSFCLELACRAHDAVLQSPCRIDGVARGAGSSRTHEQRHDGPRYSHGHSR